MAAQPTPFRFFEGQETYDVQAALRGVTVATVVHTRRRWAVVKPVQWLARGLAWVSKHADRLYGVVYVWSERTAKERVDG